MGGNDSFRVFMNLFYVGYPFGLKRRRSEHSFGLRLIWRDSSLDHWSFRVFLQVMFVLGALATLVTAATTVVILIIRGSSGFINKRGLRLILNGHNDSLGSLLYFLYDFGLFDYGLLLNNRGLFDFGLLLNNLGFFDFGLVLNNRGFFFLNDNLDLLLQIFNFFI